MFPYIIVILYSDIAQIEFKKSRIKFINSIKRTRVPKIKRDNSIHYSSQKSLWIWNFRDSYICLNV